MPGGLTLLASTNAGIPTPASGKVTIYFSTDLNTPAYKDDAGVVTSLVGATGATGASGPIGPSMVLEEPTFENDVLSNPLPTSNVALRTRLIGITIDGGGSAITTGIKGYTLFPVAGTIVKATLLADQSGSIVIDIWKDTYANYPPTVADTITAAAKPTLSGAIKSEDATLTGWTKTINAGDTFGFNVDSVATVTRVHLILEVVVTG